jgi:hypothetical protein
VSQTAIATVAGNPPLPLRITLGQAVDVFQRGVLLKHKEQSDTQIERALDHGKFVNEMKDQLARVQQAIVTLEGLRDEIGRPVAVTEPAWS